MIAKAFKATFIAIAVIGIALVGLAVFASREISTVAAMTPDQRAKYDAEQARLNPAPQLPQFAMRGLEPGSSLKSAKQEGIVEGCHEYTSSSSTTCSFANYMVAGGPSIDSFIAFERDKFTGLIVSFNENQFDTVSDALISAYGKTCRFDVKALQNAFGAKFQSVEATWCFNGGELSFVQRSKGDFRESELRYDAYGPAEKPKEFRPKDL